MSSIFSVLPGQCWHAIGVRRSPFEAQSVVSTYLIQVQTLLDIFPRVTRTTTRFQIAKSSLILSDACSLLQNQNRFFAFLSMSISLEAIFGAIAILVALPPVVVIVMRSLARRRRRRQILPLAQPRYGELLERKAESQEAWLNPSKIQAPEWNCHRFQLLSVSSPKLKC